jgi:general secretion pathway protein M
MINYLHQLSAIKRRYLAVELLLLFILLLSWFVVVPLWSASSESLRQVDDLRFQLAKYEQAVDQKALLEKHRDALTKTQLEANLFHADAAAGVVAAKIQNTIRQAVEIANGELISTQVLPEHKDQYFTRLTINVRLSGNDQVLKTLLFELETARPLLLLDKLVVTSVRRRQGARFSATPMRITLEVIGFLALNEAAQ